MGERIHFITGRLAEHSLRQVVEQLAPPAGFEYTIGVLNITVAALMTPQWVAGKMHIPSGTTRVLLPGYCVGDLSLVEEKAGVPVARGPKDLRELPQFFGQHVPANYGQFDIEILAEINHAPRWPLDELLAEADRLRSDGADLIDLGCNPGETWPAVANYVRAMRDRGHRVSIDSFNAAEIEPAVRAGAELVLSVNCTNRRQALEWGCEVVVVPDTPGTLDGLPETIDMLAGGGVRFRIDPILEPIGFGFAASLGRYLEVRQLWPDVELMMGIGNLTELTDADSAGINVLLLGFCQEVGVRSVLTTQVINWARSSVRECDLARRLVYHAVRQRTLPKHVEPRLVMLRDPRPLSLGTEALDRLAKEIRDHNYRLFADGGLLHLVSSNLHLSAADPFELFNLLQETSPKNLDAGHAFYLGYELAKATTALTLDKQYRQDESLDWGFLTRPETSHRASSAKAEQEK